MTLQLANEDIKIYTLKSVGLYQNLINSILHFNYSFHDLLFKCLFLLYAILQKYIYE